MWDHYDICSIKLFSNSALWVIHFVVHSSNTVTLLQQWKTLLHHHNVTDISANNRASCSFGSLAENKPKLQSSCQYLLLLWDLLLWAKVIRCGYQENWHQNQLWVVKCYVQRDVIVFRQHKIYYFTAWGLSIKKWSKSFSFHIFTKKWEPPEVLCPLHNSNGVAI